MGEKGRLAGSAVVHVEDLVTGASFYAVLVQFRDPVGRVAVAGAAAEVEDEGFGGGYWTTEIIGGGWGGVGSGKKAVYKFCMQFQVRIAFGSSVTVMVMV